MNLAVIPLLFIIWRVVDFFVIYFSQKIIPYLGFFPYANQLPLYHLPNWLSALANFDGLHYLTIAKNGYQQFEQAFFPFYPVLIKLFSPIFADNRLLSGIIISNLSFLIGLIIFYKYLYLSTGIARNAPTNYNHLQPFLSILFLLAFPTSFFFGAVYTEGLFFLLVVSTLYCLKKQNYLLAGLFAYLTATTRIVGVFIIVPIVIHLLQKINSRQKNSTGIARNAPTIYNYFQLFITLLAPLLGLATYCFYLWRTTGDPFYFFTSQPVFGASRSTHLITFVQVYYRYFKIFLTAHHDFGYFTAILECCFFTFVLIILILDLFKNLGIRNWKLALSGVEGLKISNYDLLALNLFSLINIILPTLTGTFLSIPRFSLMSLSLFIYLSQIKNNMVKYFILFIFVILHVLLLGYFTQGYFIS
jgi:hypothetical protein